MSDLAGQPAEVRMTVQVKRAATGVVETFELVGRTEPETNPEPEQHGNDSQHRSA